MVMQAAPRRKRRRLPRRGLRCLLGRHRIDYYRLNAAGEKWMTFVYLCLRCGRVVGDSHAVRDDKPVIKK